MLRRTTDSQNQNLAALQLPNLMVPTVRLELTQLSPLPPQDSVSTNFTTSALRALLREWRELYIKQFTRSCAAAKKSADRHATTIYFGMSFAFESGIVGVCAGTAGAVCAGAESITLADTAGRDVAI